MNGFWFCAKSSKIINGNVYVVLSHWRYSLPKPFIFLPLCNAYNVSQQIFRFSKWLRIYAPTISTHMYAFTSAEVTLYVHTYYDKTHRLFIWHISTSFSRTKMRIECKKRMRTIPPVEQCLKQWHWCKSLYFLKLNKTT